MAIKSSKSKRRKTWKPKSWKANNRVFTTTGNIKVRVISS